MKSVEQRNIEAVARYYVTWGRGEVDRLAEHCTPDFAGHDPSGGPPFGLDGLKTRLALFVRGMPGFRITSEDTIAQGDRVVMRWRTRGTFTGVFMDRPPTGASIELTGITIYRLRDGRVAELWNESDALGLFTAIGAVSPLGG